MPKYGKSEPPLPDSALRGFCGSEFSSVAASRVRRQWGGGGRFYKFLYVFISFNTFLDGGDVEYKKFIFRPPGESQEVPGGFKNLRGTGTNHLHQVSADFHGA